MRTVSQWWIFWIALAFLAGCAAPSAKYAGNYATSPDSAPARSLSMESTDADADYAEPPPEPMESIALAGAADMDEMRSESGGAGPAEAPPPPPPPPSASRPPPSKKAEAAGGKGEARGEQGAAVVRSPMLIYTADLHVQVDEAAAALARVEALTRDLGGFLERRDDASITIRVPVARFDEAMRSVEGMGEVTHRSVSTEDVTEHYMDLEIRLKNLRAIRGRLQQLLEKAEKVEESILIERELGRVNGEIERIEGKMKYLRDKAAYSTITVTFRNRPRESISSIKPRVPVPWLSQLGLGRLLRL